MIDHKEETVTDWFPPGFAESIDAVSLRSSDDCTLPIIAGLAAQ